jgi:hypothetical protein
MSKVRVFQVTTRNVHGEGQNDIVPAHNKQDAQQGFSNPDLAYKVSHKGFHEVTLSHDGSSVKFKVLGQTIDTDHPSYQYLQSYCRKDINAFEDDLREDGQLL